MMQAGMPWTMKVRGIMDEKGLSKPSSERNQADEALLHAMAHLYQSEMEDAEAQIRNRIAAAIKRAYAS